MNFEQFFARAKVSERKRTHTYRLIINQNGLPPSSLEAREVEIFPRPQKNKKFNIPQRYMMNLKIFLSGIFKTDHKVS